MAGFNEALGSAIIQVRAKTDKLKRDLNKSVGIVQGAAGKMKAAFAGVSASLGALGLVAGILAAGKAAVTAASQMETLRVSFTALLGSAEKANAVMKELQQFSAKTPFQFEGIAKTARQLLAAGVTTEQLTSRLSVLGDIASGANIPLDQMGQIFAKIQNKGRAYTEELLQLSDRGIPILATLAEQLGVTKDQVFELASQGKLTSDIMLAAFESMTSAGGPFFEQMLAQSETLAGKWSTLKDNLMLLAAALGEHLLPLLNKTVEILIILVQGINSAIGALKDLASTIKGVVTSGFNKLTSAATTATKKTEAAFKWLYDKVVGNSWIPDMVDEIGQHISRLDQTMVGKTQQQVRTTGTAFAQLNKTATTQMTSMSRSINGIFNNLIGQLGSQVGGIGGTLISSLGSLLLGGGGGGGGIGGIIGSLFGGGGGLGGLFGGGGGGFSIGGGGNSFSAAGSWTPGGGLSIDSANIGGGALGAFGSILGFADGGRPPVGKPSVVGERGPELFVPDGAGTVVPNEALGQQGMTVNVQPMFVGVDDRIQEQIDRKIPDIISASVNAVSSRISRGDKRFANLRRN